jgi:membrane protease YdiL (CAAX protease family)
MLRPEPLVTQHSAYVIIGTALVLAGIGALEEVLFRGVIQATALSVLGRAGLLFVSVHFAQLHAVYLSTPYLLTSFVAGLSFAWLVLRTRSLLGVSLAHAAANVLVYLVIPLTVASAQAVSLHDGEALRAADVMLALLQHAEINPGPGIWVPGGTGQ